MSLKRRADGHDPSGSFSNTYIPIYARSHRAQQAHIRHIRHRGARTHTTDTTHSMQRGLGPPQNTSRTQRTHPRTRRSIQSRQSMELVLSNADAAADRRRGLGSRLQPAGWRYGARRAVSRAQRLPVASDLSPSLATAVTAVLILLCRRAWRVGTSKPRLPRGWVSLDLPPPRVPQHRGGLAWPMWRV